MTRAGILFVRVYLYSCNGYNCKMFTARFTLICATKCVLFHPCILCRAACSFQWAALCANSVENKSWLFFKDVPHEPWVPCISRCTRVPLTINGTASRSTFLGSLGKREILHVFMTHSYVNKKHCNTTYSGKGPHIYSMCHFIPWGLNINYQLVHIGQTDSVST